MRRSKNIFLIIVMFLMISISTFLFSYAKSNEILVLNEKEKETISKEEETIKTVSLIMAGDVLIHDELYNDAYKDNKYDFNYFFDYVKPIIHNYDLAFCNQESMLGGVKLGLSSYPFFNSPYEVGDALINTGFNLISTANNHSFDRGEKAVINSYNYWTKQKNVIMSGTKISNDENSVKIFEKNGISFAFVAYTKGINNQVLPVGKDYLVNIIDKEKIKKEIESVRKRVDFVIVSMHWGQDVGFKPGREPIPWQEYDDGTNPEELALFLSSLNVDLIIGHHPHEIHPIETINNTLVIYSLGNFLSNQDISNDYNKRIGLLSSVLFTKHIKNNKTTLLEITNTNNELTFTDHNDKNIIKPFSLLDDSSGIDYLRLEQKYNQIIGRYDSNVPITKHN